MHPCVRTLTALLTAGALGAGLSACGSSGPGSSGASGGDPDSLVVATHDSWAMDDDVLAAFTEQTGITVKIQPQGDAGQLTNRLALTKDDPLADGVYGIDNTFGSRAVEQGVLASYAAPLPASAEQFRLAGAEDRLTPVDYSDVCVNVDETWFAERDQEPPTSLADLVDPAYEDLFVTPGATTSSPGLAFLLATVAAEGEGWQDYWRDLVANGAKVTAGWSDAYEVDFTGGGGGGDRPIVLSYSSSPPFTVPEGGSEPTTSALLDTCFRQVEYAGVLAGAANPEGMQQFIDFMLGREFQAALPDAMYVYPVDSGVALPEAWERFATPAPEPATVDPQELDANREEWLREWRDIVTQ